MVEKKRQKSVGREIDGFIGRKPLEEIEKNKTDNKVFIDGFHASSIHQSCVSADNCHHFLISGEIYFINIEKSFYGFHFNPTIRSKKCT